MADGPRATLTYEDSEDEEVNEQVDEDERAEVQADGRLPQYFIYKPKTRYPREKDEKRTLWSGPKCDPENPEVILGYGIVVHSHDGFLEILTCTNIYNQHEVKRYKPRFWQPVDMAEAVGCWLQLKFDVRSKEICAIPYPTLKLPLQTKIYQPNNRSNWDHQILIYDFVRKAGHSQFVTSDLLGLIDDSDSRVTYDRTASIYNVEYLIESWLENGECKLTYDKNPTTTTAWLRQSVQRMLLTEEELMAKREANRKEKRARLIELQNRSAHLGYGDNMVPESSTSVNAFPTPTEVEQNSGSSYQFQTNDRPQNVNSNINTSSVVANNMDDEDGDEFLVDLNIESPEVVDNEAENETFSAHSSNQHSTKPTILITFSSTGYGFYLAKQYLKNGYNVVIHSVDPVLEVEELKERLSGFLDSYIYVQGRLDNEFAATVVEGIVNKFCRIDVVLHLPTALHKAGTHVAHRPSQSSIDSRRIIVIANSVSGVKNAITSWKRIVQPIFDECRVSYEFKQTERANHAVEIMQKLDINNFTAVCVMSGDGVVTEVIRGLLTRSDRDRALRFPILHIPCGTSNALAAAMAFKSGWAGLARLHIEAFIRIARLPTLARYRVRISYKPVEDKQILRRTLMKTRDIWQKLGSEHFTSGNVEIVDDTTKKLQNDSVRLVEEAFTPTLADSIPKDWITIEGDFAFVCLCSLSHIGSDLPYIPSARLEEETFYLTLVDWRTLKTRFHMAHLLLTVDRCAHLEHSSLHMIPVTACRVEPQSQNGYSAT
ncbi:DAGKc domain-containing protein [Aphelenchoides besseyi]|nr:DAGKc domain-containing protein [Aphelenchoides besseyi]